MSSRAPSFVPTTSSTTNLVESSAKKQKDYNNAFATLQTSYGFGGAPIIPSSSTSTKQSHPSLKPSSKAQAAATSVATSSQTARHDPASLQVQYGFPSPAMPGRM